MQFRIKKREEKHVKNCEKEKLDISKLLTPTINPFTID